MKPFPAVALLDWTRSESDRMAGEVLGIHSGTASRWRRQDRHFTANEAEKLCDQIRIHPSEVWPDWYALCVE